MASNAREDRETGGDLGDKKLPKMKGMEKMVFAKYEGVNYPQPFGNGRHEEKVRKMKETQRDFTIRDDDTIIVGFPRCGNHWAFEAVSMIIRQETTFTPSSLFDYMIECFEPEREKVLDELDSPRLLWQNSYLRDLPRQAIQKRTRIIYLLREPKSALISFYKLFVELKSEVLGFGGTWNDLFEAMMEREMVWGNVIDHYKDMEDFRKKHPEIPIYIRSFEKGMNDPVQQIREMCAFLGKPDHLASDIAKATSFNAMKSGTKEKSEKDEKCFFEKGKKGFLPGAKTGVWKNWFTVAQNERFSSDLDGKLSGTEIASLLEY